MEKIERESMWRIRGCPRHYAWGGHHFLPELMGIESPGAEPYAELWFGTQPSCPSVTRSGESLRELIRASPEDFFTAAERKNWGDKLPFLFKILDVNDMLSVQIHPDKESARKGFDEEERKQIPRDAFHRTFKDENHKPEILYALSPFYMLHAFRPDDDIRAVFSRKKVLQPVFELIQAKGVQRFYREFMHRNQEEINTLLSPLVTWLEQNDVGNEPSYPDYWAKRAVRTYCDAEKIDRGILSFYLMNLLELKPGEVIFQDNSVPHSYLQGQALEVMADSDNVIRGGLTPKFVDTHRLSELIRFDQRHVYRLNPAVSHSFCRTFTPPVNEFSLSVLDLQPGREYFLRPEGISMFLSISGEFSMAFEDHSLDIPGGNAGLSAGGKELRLSTPVENRVFWVTPR